MEDHADSDNELEVKRVTDKPSKVILVEPFLKGKHLADCETAFQIVDLNKDGLIDKKQFQKLLKLMGLQPTEAEFNEFVRHIDPHANGQISLIQVTSIIFENYNLEFTDAELRTAFRIIDKDGNGNIKEEEVERTSRYLGTILSSEDVQYMVREADLDGDGQLSVKEFMNFFKNSEV